jgi:hypothetical protein
MYAGNTAAPPDSCIAAEQTAPLLVEWYALHTSPVNLGIKVSVHNVEVQGCEPHSCARIARPFAAHDGVRILHGNVKVR